MQRYEIISGTTSERLDLQSNHPETCVESLLFYDFDLKKNLFFDGTNWIDAGSYIEGIWTPILTGATSNPTVTYSKQAGFYQLEGNMCNFQMNIVTTNITKTTLTDTLRSTLPFPAINTIDRITLTNAQVSNAGAVQNAALGLISPNNSFIEFQTAPLSAVPTLLTYALLSLGILSNTITMRASGAYRIA